MKGLIKRFASRARAGCSTVFALSVIWLGLPGQAQAAVYTLSDHNSTIGLDLGSAAGMNSWLVDGVNQANQQWFWLRVGSATHESDFSQITASPTVSQATTRQLSALYANANYGVQVNYLLAGQSAGSGRSGLTESIRLYNYTATAMDFHFFQYWDLSLGGSAFGNQQNVTIGPDGALFNNVNQTAGGFGTFTSLSTPSANRAEAGLYNTTLARLMDASVTDLNLSLAAGPGHLGWALQWDFTIGANSSAVVSSINNLQVPEPSAFALVGLAVGALWIRRRR